MNNFYFTEQEFENLLSSSQEFRQMVTRRMLDIASFEKVEEIKSEVRTMLDKSCKIQAIKYVRGFEGGGSCCIGGGNRRKA